MVKHYPNLYHNIDKPLKCPVCKLVDDTNEHLGFCSTLLPTINDILLDSKKFLITQLTFYANEARNTYFVEADGNTLPLFGPIMDTHHEFYLILHQLVPSSLYELINNYTNKSGITYTILFTFLDRLHKILYQKIWIPYTTVQRDWELSHGITKSDKKKYRSSTSREMYHVILRIAILSRGRFHSLLILHDFIRP